MVGDDNDDLQTLENFYNEFTNDDSQLLITPYLELDRSVTGIHPIILFLKS